MDGCGTRTRERWNAEALAETLNCQKAKTPERQNAVPFRGSNVTALRSRVLAFQRSGVLAFWRSGFPAFRRSGILVTLRSSCKASMVETLSGRWFILAKANIDSKFIASSLSAEFWPYGVLGAAEILFEVQIHRRSRE